MVSPDQQQNHLLFSPPTTRLPTAALNNNKTLPPSSPHHLAAAPPHPANSTSPFLFTYSRKSIFSRSSHTLPPLEKVPTPRTRKGRTVPSSRNNSSKLSRLEIKSSSNLGKRSRSVSEEAALQLDGKELVVSGRAHHQVSHHQTVRVLRARSALLLPLSLPPPPPPPAQLQQLHPLILKSGREEERKKRR